VYFIHIVSVSCPGSWSSKTPASALLDISTDLDQSDNRLGQTTPPAATATSSSASQDDIPRDYQQHTCVSVLKKSGMKTTRSN